MPKLLQAAAMRVLGLRYGGELAAGAALQPDAVAQEHAARLEAARRRQADAEAPARDKPYTAQEMEFYIKGQQSMAGSARRPTLGASQLA